MTDIETIETIAAAITRPADGYYWAVGPRIAEALRAGDWPTAIRLAEDILRADARHGACRVRRRACQSAVAGLGRMERELSPEVRASRAREVADRIRGVRSASWGG